MKTWSKNMRYLAMAGLSMVLACPVAMAATVASKEGPLAGVKEVGVLVYLQHDAQTDGIDKKALQSKAELDLKAAGINVLKYGDKARYKGPGVLVLTIDVIKWTGNPINAFNVRADFIERAAVDRAGKPHLEDGSTWQFATTGIAGDLSLKDQISETVDGISQIYAHEYVADNGNAVR
jgi:hypothetical protein